MLKKQQNKNILNNIFEEYFLTKLAVHGQKSSTDFNTVIFFMYKNQQWHVKSSRLY